MAFVVLVSAYAVYSLYASAAAVRDRAAAHASLGGGDAGTFPLVGVVTAALGAVALFVLPTLTRHGGYPGNSAALVAVGLPLAAAALVVRAWGLARIAEARGLGELVAHHHGIFVAGLMALPIVAAATLLLTLVITAAGHLVELLSTHSIGSGIGLYLAALFVALTAVPAGLRAVGALARVQTALFGFGAAALLWLVIVELGGPEASVDMLARIGELLAFGTTAGRGGGDYPSALALAGALRSADDWSGLTVLSVHLELAGALLVLVWMPWSLAADGPRQLARPLVGPASLLGGALLLALGPVLGWGALWLGLEAAPAAVSVQPLGQGFVSGTAAALAAHLAERHGWIAPVFGLAALAVLHALAQTLVAAAVGALRPLAGRRLRAARGTFREIAAVQAAGLAVVIAAGVLAAASAAELVLWCEFALVLAPLALLPLMAACWFPALTGGGLAAGLILGAGAGTMVPLLTDTAPLHGVLPGLLIGIVTAFAATAMRPRDSRKLRRLDAARRIDAALAGTGDERVRTPVLVLAVVAWIFFAIGPGAVVGNDLFGTPDLRRAQASSALPSIAVWQLLCWAVGVVLVWFVAREHARPDREEAQRLVALGPAPKAAPQTDRQNEDSSRTAGP